MHALDEHHNKQNSCENSFMKNFPLQFVANKITTIWTRQKTNYDFDIKFDFLKIVINLCLLTTSFLLLPFFATEKSLYVRVSKAMKIDS